MDNLKLNRAILSGKQFTLAELAGKFQTTQAEIKKAATYLTLEGYNVNLIGKTIQTVVADKPRKGLVIDTAEFTNPDGWFLFGACGDKHMGNRHHRPDVLNAMYDMYAKEGIKIVFDTGNYIDGEARFNFHELEVYGMEAQVRNFVKNHPKRPGIITYFIAGDDHEGWYQQKLKMSIGTYTEGIAREMGRDDLRYIGYMEARVELHSKYGSAILMPMHPGGGSAYAESYTQQKIAEAFSEGEKPHVCLVGHYHKALYGVHRGIHMLQTACMEDQTSFMRKKRLKAAVGGWIVRMHQSPKGDINRFAPEYFQFFGRDFYKRNPRNFDIPGKERKTITI